MAELDAYRRDKVDTSKRFIWSQRSHEFNCVGIKSHLPVMVVAEKTAEMLVKAEMPIVNAKVRLLVDLVGDNVRKQIWYPVKQSLGRPVFILAFGCMAWEGIKSNNTSKTLNHAWCKSTPTIFSLSQGLKRRAGGG